MQKTAQLKGKLRLMTAYHRVIRHNMAVEAVLAAEVVPVKIAEVAMMRHQVNQNHKLPNLVS